MLFPLVSLGNIWQTACNWKYVCFIPVLSLWLVIEMWTVKDMHIISGIRYGRKLLGFLREPGHAEGGLTHLRNMKWPGLLPAKACCIQVFLVLPKVAELPLYEFWWLLALLKALLPFHVAFAFKGVQVLRQFAYVGFSMNYAKLEFGSWADACDREKKQLEKLGKKLKSGFCRSM